MARYAVPVRGKVSAAGERSAELTEQAHALAPPDTARAGTSQRDAPTMLNDESFTCRRGGPAANM